jgi:hypothetical protein
MQGEAAVKAGLEVDGKQWLVTCVSMGNPHAITFGTSDGDPIKVPSPTHPECKICCTSMLAPSVGPLPVLRDLK